LVEPQREAPPLTEAERWLDGYEQHLDRVLGRASLRVRKYLYFQAISYLVLRDRPARLELLTCNSGH
jgi:hypothetical protein